MSSALNYCDSVARFSPHAQPVISEISATTTPVEFEELRKKFPQFQLGHANKGSGTVLHKAATDGNVPLIEYIVGQAPYLLNRGGNSTFPFTPLCLAAGAGHVAATEALISLGADVNFTDYQTNDSLLGFILDKIQEYKKMNSPHRKVVKLLIKNGAQLPPPNSEVISFGVSRSQMTKDVLKSIREGFAQEIARERREFSDELYESVFFPKDLSNMIFDYS